MFEAVKRNLEERGFSVAVFKTGQEAAAYLDGAIDGVSVGFGGSLTLQELGLYEKLAAHNDVHWHWVKGAEERAAAGEARLSHRPAGPQAQQDAERQFSPEAASADAFHAAAEAAG